MSTGVRSSDWECLDPWWSVYAQSRSIARRPTSARVIGLERLAHCWDDIDPWWRVYTESTPTSYESDLRNAVDRNWLRDRWEELDPWWDLYTETGYETVVQLADLLERSNGEWANSDAPFDTDPLAADLTGERFSRGPPQPSNEVGWSRWLAQLLRPSGALVAELFDLPAKRPPNEVIREDRLSKRDGSYRRPDVLVCYADRGISIEVKLGDENYRKTGETARLVERHYDDREWTHALLLPKEKTGRLESIVEPPLESGPDGRLRLEWDDSAPIDVIYWRDVTAAIRSVLRDGAAVDDHWAANAYLFCAVAEQRIVNFQPQPIVDRLADPANVVDALQPIGIADTLEEQLIYFRERGIP